MTRPPPYARDSARGLVLQCKVTPRASRSALVGPEGAYLKLKLQAPPVEGAANEALVELFREIFQVPKKNIKILRGEKSRIKQVEIQGLRWAQAMTAVLRPHKS